MNLGKMPSYIEEIIHKSFKKDKNTNINIKRVLRNHSFVPDNNNTSYLLKRPIK
jgi:hypothetical protein